MKNNNIFKIIFIIFINCALIAIIGIWGYNKFVKVEPYVIRPGQYKYKITAKNCNIFIGKGTYIDSNPNSYCKATILKDGKVVRKIIQHTDENGFRVTPLNFDKNKKSIVIFGCSFPFGFGLNDNETFAWLLSEQTHRKVYNASINGGGIQQMLLKLQSEDFYKKFKNQPDTFIYLAGYDHLHRLYGPPFDNMTDVYYPIFKLKNNKLIYIPEPLPYKIGGYVSYLANYEAYRTKVNTKVENKETADLFAAILKESQKLIKKHYPNAKFIVFIFDNNDIIYNVAKDNNIEAIKLDDFFHEKNVDEKYMKIQYHPTAEFWEKITPLLIKKIKL